MKSISFIMATLVMVFTLIGAFPADGVCGEAEQLKKYYVEYISNSIAKNRSKANLQTSKSENLRTCGAFCEKKVVFLTNHRDTLVDELVENQIGTKSYKIDLYLNKRFHESLR